MFNRIPTLNKSLSFVVLLIALFFLIFSGLFLAVAICSAAVVPLTWFWGLLTGQSYDRVCDNSEIVYKLNQLGKWTIFAGVAILFIGLVAFTIL